MRKIAAIFLAALLLGGLCGCGSSSGQTEAVCGTWEYVGYYDSDAMLELFVHLDLYEEEIALMDPAGIAYVEYVTFREDHTYTIACDTRQSSALAMSYYVQAFDQFYEHREELEKCYGVSFGMMDRDTFFQFYADLYGVSSYEGLIAMFTMSTVDPSYLAEGEENGTFRIMGQRIYCTANDSDKEQYVRYDLEDDTLTLSFYQWDKSYTRK